MNFEKLIKGYILKVGRLQLHDVELESINAISDTVFFSISINASDYMLFKENIGLVFNPIILFKTNGIIKVDGVQADINLLLNEEYKPAVTEVTLMDNCSNAIKRW